MNRRAFLRSSGLVAFGASVPCLSSFASASSGPAPFRWSTNDLVFSFEVNDGRLRQKRLVPAGAAPGANTSSGVEVALQCSGEDSPDQGMKSGLGQPGARLLFIGRREESTLGGNRLVVTHTDPILRLRVGSVYEAFDGVPVVRRHSRVTNEGREPVGIEFLSSAMLHGLADPQNYDRDLRIHVALNSWMAEGQWHTLRPSEMGFVENERTSRSEAQASSVGTWSTVRYLPMAMAENVEMGIIWFWQLDRELKQERSSEPSEPRIRCPLCGWSPAKRTDGSAPAAMGGTLSIQEECAPLACTNGLTTQCLSCGRWSPHSDWYAK